MFSTNFIGLFEVIFFLSFIKSLFILSFKSFAKILDKLSTFLSPIKNESTPKRPPNNKPNPYVKNRKCFLSGTSLARLPAPIPLGPKLGIPNPNTLTTSSLNTDCDAS